MRVLLLTGMLLWTGQLAAQEAAPPDKARIRQLVEQLGDNAFKVREAAHRELAKLAEYAIEELIDASSSDDLERSQRAKQILGWPDAAPTHQIVDALGQPIKAARFVIKQVDFTHAGFADRLGRFAIPGHDKRPNTIVVDIRHPAYGHARWQSQFPRKLAESGLFECKLPLVAQDSEARKRAVHGQVVDGHGKPVVGAVIHCPNVRTQGEGLLSAAGETGDVLTDGQGRFALYLAAGKPYRDLKMAGDLVPPGSRYNLSVTAPGRDDCFPIDDMFANGAPVEIRMPLAKRLYRIRFAQMDDVVLARFLKSGGFHIQFYPKEEDRRFVSLPAAELVKGRKLIPGKYVATRFGSGQAVHYLPLRVDEKSPEVLTFELPAATVFRGRAVHGVTGEPLPRVWAAATGGIARANLAELSKDDWQQMRPMPDVAGPNDPAMKILGAHYGIGALVRTGDDGRFAITQPPGNVFFNIMAFAEDFIPLTERVVDFKGQPTKAAELNLDDLPLFPAAKLQVKVVTTEKSLAISPQWKWEKGDQPEWSEKLRSAASLRGSQRTYEYNHWIGLNEVRPIFIPSGLPLRIEIRSPYDPRWGTATTEIVRAKQGEVLAVLEIHLPKSLPVTVRIVDDKGKALEGLAVRSRMMDDIGWSVPHNTDAKGLAQFYFPPHSSGRLRVDIPGETPNAQAPEAQIQVRDGSPAAPFEIRLTAEQARVVRDPQSKKK